MSARDDLAYAAGALTPALKVGELLDAYRAEVLREAAAICRAQAPKYLDNEVDTAIFWALDSAAGKIVADDKT